MAFPTLDHKSIKITSEDNAIKSNQQSGLVITRQRYTKSRKTVSIELNKLNLTDKNTLQSFYDGVETVLSFQWTNPDDVAQTLTVRFDAPISINKDATNATFYVVDSFKLVEV